MPFPSLHPAAVQAGCLPRERFPPAATVTPHCVSELPFYLVLYLPPYLPLYLRRLSSLIAHLINAHRLGENRFTLRLNLQRTRIFIP